MTGSSTQGIKTVASRIRHPRLLTTVLIGVTAIGSIVGFEARSHAVRVAPLAASHPDSRRTGDRRGPEGAALAAPGGSATRSPATARLLREGKPIRCVRPEEGTRPHAGATTALSTRTEERAAMKERAKS